MMKRASYRRGVEHIALTDEPTELDPAVVTQQISVGLLADLFGVSAARVAQDVVRFRQQENEDLPPESANMIVAYEKKEEG